VYFIFNIINFVCFSICSCCLGGGPGIELNTHHGLPYYTYLYMDCKIWLCISDKQILEMKTVTRSVI
ncbi:hypothetical protein L9F63_027463, partial [Diploptera punctata]